MPTLSLEIVEFCHPTHDEMALAEKIYSDWQPCLFSVTLGTIVRLCWRLTKY